MQKPNQKKLRVATVIKRKDDNLDVKWTGYGYNFNSSIDKKDILNIEQLTEITEHSPIWK